MKATFDDEGLTDTILMSYSSKFASQDQAAAALCDLWGLDPSKASLNKIRFRVGRNRRAWVKNCVSIGLSSCFLEPLESTSIYLIQEGVSRFIALFPDASLPQVVRDEYNRHMVNSYDPIRDFLILHYTATRRTGPFWDHVRTME